MGKSLSKSRFVEMFGDPIKNDKCWKTATLNSVCEGIGDGLHGTPEYDNNGEFPFINGNNLKDGKIEITPQTRMVNEQTYKNNYIKMNKNSLLLSINGTLGKIAFYNDERIMLGKSACYINLKQEINRNFVYNVMKTPAFLGFLENNSTASTIKNVGLKAIRNFQLILPPEEKQNEFVSFSDQLDKSKFILQKMIEKLELLKKSRFIELFGDIKEKNKWPREKWSDVCEIINGKDFKSVEDPNGQYAVYGTGGFMAKANQYTCPENSIIIGRKGTINKPLLVKEKFWNIDTAFGVVPNITKVHYQYFYWFCKQFNFMSINKGTTLPSTTKTDLQKIEINVPPLELQLHFSHLVDQIDKSKLILQKQLEDLVGETK